MRKSRAGIRPNVMTKDEARQIAANIAKVAELLQQLTGCRLG
jgi:hypothetical protein